MKMIQGELVQISVDITELKQSNVHIKVYFIIQLYFIFLLSIYNDFSVGLSYGTFLIVHL